MLNQSGQSTPEKALKAFCKLLEIDLSNNPHLPPIQSHFLYYTYDSNKHEFRRYRYNSICGNSAETVKAKCKLISGLYFLENNS